MKKMNALTYIALALTFIGAVGSILLFIAQNQSSAKDKKDIIENATKENKVLNERISELRSEREELKIDLEARDRKIDSQNLKIESLNNLLLEKSDYIQTYVTGGNNYPMVEVRNTANTDIQNVTMLLTLVNENTTPIYNINIEGIDHDYYRTRTFVNHRKNNEISIMKVDYENAKVAYTYIPELAGKTDRLISIAPKKLVEFNYVFYINARNRSINQKMVGVINGTTLYVASQIFDSSGNLLKEIYTDIPASVLPIVKTKLNELPKDITVHIAF